MSHTYPLIFIIKPDIVTSKGVRPYINQERCSLCKECIQSCTYDVFTMEKAKVYVSNTGDCIECLVCIEICPDNAITLDD
jgi:NAD-dependent dihydropyrimidine dehydrogenase PreA subunit